MNKVSLFVVFIFVFCLTSFRGGIAAPECDKIIFWNQARRGANIFNHQVARSDIRAAKAYGIAFIRLAPDKFLASQKDFLIGDADNYEELVSEDLSALKRVLDVCAEEKMPVVLTMLSLPGSRWKQNNNNADDLRIWSNPIFQKQAAKFWQDLARELKKHPAIVGYNILNEPHPERLDSPSSIHIHQVNPQEIQVKLFQFYNLVITAIRKVDTITPIILDSSSYSDAKAFRSLKVHPENYILYSFHMYEPFVYTNFKKNQGKYTYPGIINGKRWDKLALKEYMKDIDQFQERNNIPSNRILVGEFGGHRASRGLPKYFKDLISIFIEKKWHFAFYAFREDTWDGMDYELGDQKLPWLYWKTIEEGNKPKVDRKGSYAQFKILREAMR
jgi:endoglucanase